MRTIAWIGLVLLTCVGCGARAEPSGTRGGSGEPSEARAPAPPRQDDTQAAPRVAPPPSATSAPATPPPPALPPLVVSADASDAELRGIARFEALDLRGAAACFQDLARDTRSGARERGYRALVHVAVAALGGEPMGREDCATPVSGDPTRVYASRRMKLVRAAQHLLACLPDDERGPLIAVIAGRDDALRAVCGEVDPASVVGVGEQPSCEDGVFRELETVLPSPNGLGLRVRATCAEEVTGNMFGTCGLGATPAAP